MRTHIFAATLTLLAAAPLSGQAPPMMPYRAPNELGRIPILEYHQLGDADSRWTRSRASFKRDLELLYARGYRPITVAELVDKHFDIPKGMTPVVFTFDDASPGQFSYIERNGALEVDPKSVIGIWLDFAKSHPGWGTKATFCLLPGAAAGHAFFGDKGIDGQQTAWRYKKLQFLVAQGFELCNHTLWHAQLNKYSDAVVQEQIGRSLMAIDSAVADYKVRTFALPLGLWPKNRALTRRGSYTDPKTHRTITYSHDAVLEVSGGPARSPYDPQFDAGKLPRWQVLGNTLEQILDQLDKNASRYVSDGDPKTVAKPSTK
jgi:peptidoglycan/xylan/chitin deacetylase (PgdA/CDA1 family)